MRMISYRWKHRLKKAARVTLILLGVLLLLFLCVMQYLERYVVYDSNGAHIDLSASHAATEAPQPTGTTPPPDVELIIESQEALPTESEPLVGYYISTQMLRDIDAVEQAVLALDAPCPILLEVKSIFGNYYYSTALSGAPLADVETKRIDVLISSLKARGFYLIAQVPAFCDRAFALENPSCGLPVAGGALWADENHCYWLDPANETVISYLRQISRELSGLGFQEVVFSDFRFPGSSAIIYNAEKTQEAILSEAADAICSFFSGSNLTISFRTNDTAFPIAQGTGRIYVSDVDATKVERIAAAFSGRLTDMTTQLVFLADSRDARFSEYSLLRPLIP